MVNRKTKDSKIGWIGEVPHNWKIVRVKLLFEIGRGRVIAKTELKDDGKYPVYSSQTKDNGILGYINSYDYEQDQLTWTTDGANAGTVFLRRGKYNCTNVCGTLRPMKKEINLNYMLYALEHIAHYHKRADTNGFKIMSNEMAAIKITFPPLSEQQKIASFLDEKVAHIDNIIEDTKKSIEYLKAYKQSLITETVTKGLDANVEMKDSGVEWIGEIPKHWVLSKIKYRVSLRSEKELYQIGEKYIGLEHIESNNGRIHSYDEDYSGGLTDRFKSGDVLFSKLRPYLAKGFIASFDGYCSGELLTFKDVEGDKRYLLYYILSENFIDAINASTYGTKMPRANWDYIKELPIPCFPIYEQQVIAGFLDKKTSHIDSLIRNKKKMLQEIEAYKKSLIYEYVTGKKEVQ